jgi:glutamyl endopeptidase
MSEHSSKTPSSAFLSSSELLSEATEYSVFTTVSAQLGARAHAPPSRADELITPERLAQAEVPTHRGYDDEPTAVDADTDAEVLSPTRIAADECLEPAPEQLAEATEVPEVSEALFAERDPDEAEFAFLAGALPSLVGPAGMPLAQSIRRFLTPRARAKLATIVARLEAQRGPRAQPCAWPPSSIPPAPTPTRDLVISTLAKVLIEAGAKPAQAAPSPYSETYATQVAAILEATLARDNRVRITQTHDPHWRRICALVIDFGGGRILRATGFLISPRVVVTAGHCVYMRQQGGWARKITVIPGADGTRRPYGAVESTHFRSVAGWVQHERHEADYACIVLPRGAFGAALGQFGFAAIPAQGLLAKPAVLAGYPPDKRLQMWGAGFPLSSVGPRVLSYPLEAPGAAGAPVYIVQRGHRVVVGIHTRRHRSGGSALRISPAIYARLLSWARLC